MEHKRREKEKQRKNNFLSRITVLWLTHAFSAGWPQTRQSGTFEPIKTAYNVG
jgi:hypothetical protein